eukprot:5785399-Amphidinium_carterae.1
MQLNLLGTQESSHLCSGAAVYFEIHETSVRSSETWLHDLQAKLADGHFASRLPSRLTVELLLGCSARRQSNFGGCFGGQRHQ